jgi:hypothetical protein
MQERMGVVSQGSRVVDDPGVRPLTGNDLLTYNYTFELSYGNGSRVNEPGEKYQDKYRQ